MHAQVTVRPQKAVNTLADNRDFFRGFFVGMNNSLKLKCTANNYRYRVYTLSVVNLLGAVLKSNENYWRNYKIASTASLLPQKHPWSNSMYPFSHNKSMKPDEITKNSYVATRKPLL